jgi:hypothetical protein
MEISGKTINKRPIKFIIPVIGSISLALKIIHAQNIKTRKL